MVDDNPPLMMSIHQLTSLGNFGTFSNFSLFFAPWNITKIIILCHYRNCDTWAKVLTKSKDFKWFRRSPLLHNSWNKVIFKKIITCHLPVQGRMVTFRCTPQAFWPGLGGSRFSSPFNEDIKFEKALKLQQVTILQFNKKRKYRILDIW